MMFSASLILLFALVIDWRFGEPSILWSRFPHPIVLFGKTIGYFERGLNRNDLPNNVQYRRGALGIVLLVIGAGGAGFVLKWAFSNIGLLGGMLECLMVSVLLAQRSLYDHVNDVALAFSSGGIEMARKKVALIVGRDPQLLNEEGVCRASIETLAENFSDGVVAPAFWYLVFGLPGLFIYKMINTADSMIAYRNPKYLYFGRVTAQLDDLANWLPARISACILAGAAAAVYGIAAGRRSITMALAQAGLHRSPNAGWPEAAMAGGLDIALGGPRIYPTETVPQAYINGAGKRHVSVIDISNALGVFGFACYILWGVVTLVWIINLA